MHVLNIIYIFHIYSGLSCELQCHAVKSSANEILTSEKELSLKTKELERARQSQNVVSRKLEKEMEDEVPLLQQKVNSLMMEMKILRKQLKHRNEELELFEEFQPSISQSQLNVLDRLMLQKNEEIKTLQNKLEVKEMEIAIARKMLQEKEKELVKLMEELNAKSARVLLLEEEVEQLRYSFSEKQEEMNRKVIEASTSSVSYENFIIDLQVSKTTKMLHEIQVFIL